MRSTHTYATLEVSAAAYDEIRGKLEAAGYEHAFDGERVVMQGLALVRGEPAEEMNDILNRASGKTA